MELFDFPTFLTDFEGLCDPRIVRHRKYPLLEILFLCVSAGLCGYQEWEEIAAFGRLKLPWLRTYLPFRAGIPSHDTLNRVLQLLDPRAFERCFVQWSTRTLVLPSGTQLCFDGKRLRRSATAQQQQTAHAAGGRSAVHLLNAWCDEVGGCLGQYQTGDKNNEVSALPALLELLDVRGCVVSADAGFGHRCVATALQQAGADYLLALKGNQANLLASTQHAFQTAAPDAVAFAKEAPEPPRHGRLEERQCRLLPAHVLPEAQRAAWPGLTTLVEVQSYRKQVLSGVEQTETRYYLSSLAASPETFQHLVRRHWRIENNLHWVLDVVLGEDASRKRAGHAAANYAAIRKMVLRLLRDQPGKPLPLKRKQLQCALSDAIRAQCLGLEHSLE